MPNIYIADCVAQWSSHKGATEQRKVSSEFHPILVNGNQLEVFRSAKLLGVTITGDLSWDQHFNETVNKVSKRLYFLVQLKRAKLPCWDLVLFYVTCIRSILVYAATVFFYALPKYTM